MKALVIIIGVLGLFISQLLLFVPYENKGKTLKSFLIKNRSEMILALISFVVLIIIFIDDNVMNWVVYSIREKKELPDSLIVYTSALFIGMVNVGIIKTLSVIFKAVTIGFKQFIINQINKLKTKKNGTNKN